MTRIDEMIEAARNAAKNAEGEEKTRLQAKAEALLEMKDEGFKLSGDEVSGLVRRKEDDAKEEATKWAALMGMSYEDAEKVLEEFNDEDFQDLISAYDSSKDDGEEKPVLERVQSALKERDSKIEDLSTSLSDINRRYAKDKVDVAVERAFLDAKYEKDLLPAAKNLTSLEDLYAKVAKGEPITNDEINAKVEGVTKLSGGRLQSSTETGDDDTTTVAGHKIKADGEEVVVRPHIPATPNGNGSAQITDEDRAARAASAY